MGEMYIIAGLWTVGKIGRRICAGTD